MDRIGADYSRAIQMIQDRLAAVPLILQLPWGMEDQFKGIINLLDMTLIAWKDESLGAEFEEVRIPDEEMDQALHYRELLMEVLADKDDILMERYLSEEEIPVTEIKEAIRRATIKLQVIPVLCGAALRNKGIQPLLDAVVDYLPSPLDIPPIEGHIPASGKVASRPADPKGPFSALAFKIMMDSGRKMTYLRVYSGTVHTGDSAFNPGRGVSEKLARLLKMHSNKRERIDQASAGDIVAAMGLKLTTTGDTLCSEKDPILLEPIGFYEPVISAAIEPKKVQDQERLFDALSKMAEEGPHLSVPSGR